LGTTVIGDAQAGWSVTASESWSNYFAESLLLDGWTKHWASLTTIGIKELTFTRTNDDPVPVTLVHLAGHNGSRQGTFRTRFKIGGSTSYDTAPFGPAVLSIPETAENTGIATSGTWNQTDFTIEFWFLPYHDLGHALAIRSGATNKPTLRVAPDGHVIFEDTPGPVSTLTSTPTITARRWIHIAGTLSGTTAHLILHDQDGTLLQDLSATVSGWDPGTLLGISPTIGTYADFSGLMNEIRYWSTAHSESAIAAALFTPATGGESGLLAVYGGEAPDSAILNNRVAAGADMTLTSPHYAYGNYAYGTAIARTGLWPTNDLEDEEWRDAFVYIPDGVSCDEIVIDLLDPLSEEDRIRLSRVAFSDAIQFDNYRSVSGTTFASYTDYSPIERNLLGQASGYKISPQREFVARIGSDEDWVWNAMARMYKRAGVLGDVSAIADPEAETVDAMNLGLRRFEESFQVPYTTWQRREWSLRLRAA